MRRTNLAWLLLALLIASVLVAIVDNTTLFCGDARRAALRNMPRYMVKGIYDKADAERAAGDLTRIRAWAEAQDRCTRESYLEWVGHFENEVVGVWEREKEDARIDAAAEKLPKPPEPSK